MGENAVRTANALTAAMGSERMGVIFSFNIRVAGGIAELNLGIECMNEIIRHPQLLPFP